ncbi:hypothetical protein NPN16_24225, partial [Vibrio parahaemolyticus]|nr:hypothetical protein [Vibrio parahaemolyticus]
ETRNGNSRLQKQTKHGTKKTQTLQKCSSTTTTPPAPSAAPPSATAARLAAAVALLAPTKKLEAAFNLSCPTRKKHLE